MCLMEKSTDLWTNSILPSISSDSMGMGSNSKHQLRLYITVATAVFQPIIIYWLTSHLVR
uniref:Uncharacterized protein n=1 Tax=Poecilia mexicana TaxID=48701 RepID=A0A3B3WXW0_9TELE